MQHLLAKNVHEVVVRMPKTLGPDTTVGQARAAFRDDHVHMLLITDDRHRLLGTLVREDLLERRTSDSTIPALEHAILENRTISPNASAATALQLMLAQGERRRAVVDREGVLLGLLCLKHRHDGFCSDADVLARALAVHDG